MAILDELKQRLAVSLAQRTGLCEIQEHILSIEEKLDWIIENKDFDTSSMDLKTIVNNIHMRPRTEDLCVVFITDDNYFDITLVALWTLYEYQKKTYNVKLIAYRCCEDKK